MKLQKQIVLINNIQKARVYLRRGQRPPKGAVIHRGARNGQWYEGTHGVVSMEELPGDPSKNQYEKEKSDHIRSAKAAFNSTKEKIINDHNNGKISGEQAIKTLESVKRAAKSFNHYQEGKGFEDMLQNHIDGEDDSISHLHADNPHINSALKHFLNVYKLHRYGEPKKHQTKLNGINLDDLDFDNPEHHKSFAPRDHKYYIDSLEKVTEADLHNFRNKPKTKKQSTLF